MDRFEAGIPGQMASTAESGAGGAGGAAWDDYRPRIVREPGVVAMRQRLARTGAGGTAARPVEVESASQVEVRALSMPCLRCDGPYRLDEHTAERIGGVALRVLDVQCGHCGATRRVYFKVRG
jgi:hypothetical protein